MLFRDLLNLPFNCESNTISLDALESVVDSPIEVVQQVFVDHGRKAEFQSQYGNLNLISISWYKEAITGADLVESSHFEGFDHWYNTVRHRGVLVATKGWSCIDTRKSVIEYWAANLTWRTRPVLIDGTLVNRPSKFHLVEGHTRVGLLAGLIDVGILDKSTTHEVWIGRYVALDPCEF